MAEQDRVSAFFENPYPPTNQNVPMDNRKANALELRTKEKDAQAKQ